MLINKNEIQLLTDRIKTALFSGVVYANIITDVTDPDKQDLPKWNATLRKAIIKGQLSITLYIAHRQICVINQDDFLLAPGKYHNRLVEALIWEGILPYITDTVEDIYTVILDQINQMGISGDQILDDVGVGIENIEISTGVTERYISIKYKDNPYYCAPFNASMEMTLKESLFKIIENRTLDGKCVVYLN